jgi:hypothetical protein
MSKNTGVTAASAGKSQFVKSALRELAKCTELQNKWMTDEVWVAIMKERFTIPPSITITTTDLNVATARDPVMKVCLRQFSVPNILCIYKADYDKGRASGKGCRKISGYCVTKPDCCPPKPGGSTKWHESIIDSANNQPKRLNTRQQPAIKRSLPILPIRNTN